MKPPARGVETDSGVPSHKARVPAALAGSRLDQAAASLFPDYSRSRLQAWIKSGELCVDGRPAQAKQKLVGGECLELEAQPEEAGDWRPQAMALSIVYEDEALLVVDKPAGLVVHPAAGNPAGTLLNALLHHCPELIHLPRAGIIHRLDKDTTGLMVVAKTLAAHHNLVEQLQARRVGREYDAVVMGHLPCSRGTVDAPIGRHPRQRKQMAVLRAGGKAAITHYQVVEQLGPCSHLRLKLETGRTHQIRVHMQHLGFPLVGDPTYGRRRRVRDVSPTLVEVLNSFPRQALHARRLRLLHPESGKSMVWEAALPKDLDGLLEALRAESAGSGS